MSSDWVVRSASHFCILLPISPICVVFGAIWQVAPVPVSANTGENDSRTRSAAATAARAVLRKNPDQSISTIERYTLSSRWKEARGPSDTFPVSEPRAKNEIGQKWNCEKWKKLKSNHMTVTAVLVLDGEQNRPSSFCEETWSSHVAQ